MAMLPRSSFFSMSPSLLTSSSLKIFEIAWRCGRVRVRGRVRGRGRGSLKIFEIA